MKLKIFPFILGLFLVQVTLLGCQINGKVFKEGASTEEVGQDPNAPNPGDGSSPGDNTGNSPLPQDSTAGNILVNGSTVTTSSGHKVSVVIGDLEFVSISGGYSVEPIVAK